MKLVLLMLLAVTGNAYASHCTSLAEDAVLEKASKELKLPESQLVVEETDFNFLSIEEYMEEDGNEWYEDLIALKYDVYIKPNSRFNGRPAKSYSAEIIHRSTDFPYPECELLTEP